MAAPHREHEIACMAALERLQVLDSAPETEFDALVKIASSICEKPISLISLIDADRQWFKANVGLSGVSQTPREQAFCGYAVLGDDLFEVEDAAEDARFEDNPLVVGRPDIRFYAGAPITLSGGERIGTICVIDSIPGKLTEHQRQVLQQLSIAASKMLEGRLALKEYKKSIEAAAASDKNLRIAIDNVPAMIAYWNHDLTCRFANAAYREWFGVEPEWLLGRRMIELVGPALLALNKPYLDGVLQGQAQTFEREITSPLGETKYGLARYVPDVVDGKVVGFVALVSDVTPLKSTEMALRVEIAERERTNNLLLQSSMELAKAQRLGAIGNWSWQVAVDQVKWSPELFRILGCDPSAGTPSFVEQALLYRADSFAQLQVAVRRALETGEAYQLDMAFVRPDGVGGWLEARGEAVHSAEGKVVQLRGTVQDITERRRIQDELATQHELLRVTLDSIGDAVITTDAFGVVTWLNPVAERMTGWLAMEGKGRPLTQVFHIVNEETRAISVDPVATCLAQGRIVGLADHTLLISRDGTEFGIEDSAAPIRNADGEILGAVLVFHDVSEQRRMSGEMTYRATHDALTGLVNRAEFEKRLQRTLREAHEQQSEHAFLYIDLDQFKLVNDSCGHSVGDQLLQQVGKLLGENIRSRDTLARLGGDEFAVLLEHCSADQASQVAQKICERMDDFRFMHEERLFRIGTSIGLVPIDNRWANIAAIQQAADTSCYAAKEAGRNRVHVWLDTDMAMRTRRVEMQWTSRIERALDDDGFVLFAQRIERLKPEQGLHAEVLLRMKNEDGTMVQPGAFLPAAERYHLASRVDRWVLQKAVNWLKTLPTIDCIHTLSVNLSGQSIGDRAFHVWANKILAQAGGDVRARLCLEVTETAAVTNMADATNFVAGVRAIGVRVALDDFGAGASSFGYLKTLPVDYLKIDGQFVRDLIEDPLDDVAVACFIEVARVVGVKTIAEFVETPAVMERLREMGVDYVQGYLIHRPEPIDHLLEDLSSQSDLLCVQVS